MKKVMAFLLALFAVVSFAGCGKSFDGYYVGNAINEKETDTYVMEIKPTKNNKEYTLSIYQAGYDDKLDVLNKSTSKVYGNMFAVFRTKPLTDEEKNQYGGPTKFHYKLVQSFRVPDPGDTGVINANMMGYPISFSIDKEGNITDTSNLTTGSYLNASERVFKKVNNFKKEDLKPDLQKKVMEYFKTRYNDDLSILKEDTVTFEG